MDIFRLIHSTLISQAMKCASYLMVCALLWSCNSNSDELEKQELALYNDTVDQLAWQCDEVCNGLDGVNAILRSTQHSDSIKNIMRTQTDRRVLYYQPKIGGTHKISVLADWLVVEIGSWDRSFSTFSSTVPKKMLPSLTVSSALNEGDLHVLAASVR